MVSNDGPYEMIENSELVLIWKKNVIVNYRVFTLLCPDICHCMSRRIQASYAIKVSFPRTR